ncbi:unnamed protein product [Trypanosoma congolense IL3000]|uniref:WGS project CAEQ00000000 data, annotated contig 530 n=1 Tax=Trypanosoma congolense (strain IL3000) TaxID=1068625 RepID=F9WGQ5_TRYCI|nr:unnamed protein product [Trypanosoma congolense IL3000]
MRVYIRMWVCVVRGCCCCVLVCVRCPSFVRIIPIRIRPGVVCGVCWGSRTWWGAAVVPAAISKTRLGARTCPNTRPPCRSLSLVLRGCLRLCARPAGARKKEVVWRRRRVLMPPDAYCVRTGSLFSLFFSSSSSSFPSLPTCVGRVEEEVCVFGGRRCSGRNMVSACVCTQVCWSRLSQRVAMDDLASYFVEERSKVR